MIMQIIQAAHAGGTHGNQLCRAGILPKQIVKQAGVVEVLRNGDFQLLLLLRLSAEGQRRVGGQQDAHHRAGDNGNADIPHAGGKAERHGEENAGNVTRRAGRGAESHKAERAGDSHACAEVAVHEQNDNLHHRGQQRQRDGHGLGIGVLIHIDCGNECAERQRRQQTDNERAAGQAGGQNRTENCLKHSRFLLFR